MMTRRLIRVFGLLCTLTFTACSSSTDPAIAQADPSKDPPKDSPIGKARRLSELGQHEQAIRMVEGLLSENPENGDAHFMLGVFLASKAIPVGETEVLDRAARAFDAALKLETRQKGARALSGYVSLRAGRSQAAERTLSACAQAGESQCAAMLGELVAGQPESLSKVASIANLASVDGSATPTQMPDWPAGEEGGIFHVAAESIAPKRVDSGEETEALNRFDAVEVTRFKDELAIFRDARGKESVIQKGWESRCSASGNRNPPCGCAKGSRAGRDLFGIRSKPRRGRHLLNKKQAARRAKFTGRDTVLGIGLGVRVRYCEAAWTVKKFVDKSVPASSLRAFPGDSQEAAVRAKSLRAIASLVGERMTTAILDGKWIQGMPFFALQIMDARTRVRPSAVAVRDGAIHETYEVGATRFKVVGGYIEAVDVVAPLAASPRSTPKTGEPKTASNGGAAAPKLPEDRLFSTPPANAVVCGSKEFAKLASAVRAHCKAGKKRPTCEVRAIFKTCDGKPPGPAAIGWVHRKDFDARSVSVPVFAPRASWDVFFTADADDGTWRVTKVDTREG